TYPPMTFDYTLGESDLVDNPGAGYPTVTYTDTSNNVQTTPFSLADNFVRVMDVNGDGLKDIVKSYNISINNVDYPIFYVLKNNGDGWTNDTANWTQPEFSYVDASSATITSKFIFNDTIDIGDWNGD